MDSLETGEARLQAVETELAEVNLQIKRLEARKRKRTQPPVTEKFTNSLGVLLLFLYIFSGHDLKPPALWLAGFGRPKRCRQAESEPGAFENQVATLYLEADLDFITDLWLSPARFLPDKIVWRLSRYLVEYNIYCFTVAANTKHSTAPSTVLLEARRNQFVPTDLPEEVKKQLLALLLDRGWQRKQWLFSMRSKWSMPLKVLKRVPAIGKPVLLQRALVFYQCMNSAISSTPPEKQYVVVNLDETSVSYGYYGQKGMVVSRRHCPFDIPEPHEVEAKACLRGSMTLISLISSDASYQQKLPQFLIANKHKLSQRDFMQLGTHPNFHIWRRDSAWNSAACMRSILTLLQQALLGVTIILVLDCAPIHLEKAVLTHAKKLKIVLVFVPALCTWALQPLDVFVFAQLKALLRLLFQNALVDKIDESELSTMELISIIVQASQEVVIDKSWGKAFQSCGVCGQASIGGSTLKKLGTSSLQPPSDEVPSVAAIASILPRNRHQLSQSICSFYTKTFHAANCEAQETAPCDRTIAPASPDLPSRTPDLRWRLRPRKTSQKL